MGFTALHSAAIEGDTQEIRRCIEGLDVDRDGLFNRHDPQPAVITNRPKGIHGRFNKPIDATTRGSMGESALHKAASEGRLEVCAYLLSAANESSKQAGIGGSEALVRLRNTAGQTALHLACFQGSLPTVRLLLEAGSDLGVVDDIDGLTPLHCAIRNGHVYVAEALLEHGADPNATDGTGGTALHTAARYDVADAVDLLAGGGCSLDHQRDHDHFSALHLACKFNRTPNTVQALLQARADPGLISRAGYPPAYLAASQGVKEVVDFMNQSHFEQLLKNSDQDGMTRLREGGQLTVRASFDKALQRMARDITDAAPGGLWWDPRADVRPSGEYAGFDVAVEGGVPFGKWVAGGPMTPGELEAAMDQEFARGFGLMRSKVGLYASEERIRELVDEELKEPSRALRELNEQWTLTREAVEGFRFVDALEAVEAAAKVLKEDWWGRRAGEGTQRLVDEILGMRGVVQDADKALKRAGRHLSEFAFQEGAEWFRKAAPLYSKVGHGGRYAEAVFQLRECEEKAELKAEADSKRERSVSLMREYEPVPPLEGGEEPCPPTRLRLGEAEGLLSRVVEIYRGYGDESTLRKADARLKAAVWGLERQGKAEATMGSAKRVFTEYEEDTACAYAPTREYPYPKLHTLRFADSVADFLSAGELFLAIKDTVNDMLCRDYAKSAQERYGMLQTARQGMEEGHAALSLYAYDGRLKGIVVFGGDPIRKGDPPRAPYCRHTAHDYPLRDDKVGVAWQRLRIEEASKHFQKALRMFGQIEDHTNTDEARRRADDAAERLSLQAEAHECVKEGQASVKQRQYAAGQERYKRAFDLLSRAGDEANAGYVKGLASDAATKRKLAEEAAGLVDRGRELVSRREAFVGWLDVVAQGLPAFAEAEEVFAKAEALFEALEDPPQAKAAGAARADAEERKVHAEELKTCRAVVVQPAGEWAPQRKEKNRRTMPYETAEQAILDAATTGKTSTYHEKANIRAGSTVVLRAGQHRVSNQAVFKKQVTVAAEEGMEADGVLVIADGHSLALVESPGVRFERVTLRQVAGQGDEDYWSGGITAVRCSAGDVTIVDSVVHSGRGSGVVVEGTGKALLQGSKVLDCGHYGVAADGKEALVDLRGTEVDGSKFEEVDERNGARVVGFERSPE